ncbi:NADH-ubiquinone oxidoreductase chain 2 (mitochondrion) [[Candida] railenensis]|uniref:NADH-ubiquinone oxidoreductase chain 2 n=1 Tax=[Candida] railenensis TaxID=45579 RepID=UPI002028CA18|nr:NADH-ubiquinone oxidoreductase chain 2 [[Candida] railenensis]CAH2356115.1 NADH-ubiquinone oxidoreductase chain 2 [[Candida] railenensis]
MTIIAFLSFLVFSTYFSPLTINRMNLLLLMFITFIFNSSYTLFSINDGMSIYNDWFFINNSNLYFINIMLMTVMLLLTYNSFYKSNNMYFSLIMLANTLGLMLFPLINDMLSLYILIELQSYSLYMLTGINNKSFNSSRAALLYFLMGGMASCLMLLASYFIYESLGTTNLSEIWTLSYYIDMSLFNYMLMMALLFKMGLAPLHRWSMAVYNYAPTYMTAYMSMVAKMSMMSFMFTWTNNLDLSIMYMFFMSSLVMGAYKPLYQVNIKTMLAYSGLLNFSYLLLSMIINSEMSSIGFYLYLSQYVMTHMLMFLMMLTASYYMTSPMSEWSPLTFMHQLNFPNKALSGCLMMALFSLMGLPPTPGFYAKLLMFTSALSANYMFESLLMMFFSVMATYYYANMMKMLMKNPVATMNNMSPVLAYMMSYMSMLLLFMFVYLDTLLQGTYLFMM